MSLMGCGGRSTLVALCAVMATVTAGCSSRLFLSGSQNSSSSAAADASRSSAPGVHSSFPYGPFAGYLWLGRVDSVRADFTVPRILAGSPVSRAATWIGAQGDGSPGPFIQVGVTEERGAAGDRYYAFWSDVVHDFTPQRLYPVTPGDEIDATLTHADGRWHVEVGDANSDRDARFATTQEGHAAFDTAQWYQEDVTDSLVNRPFAYPRLSPVRFATVAVDGVDPGSQGLDYHWLRAPDGSVIAPGPITRRRFAIGPLMHEPSPAGVHFLEIAHAEDGPALHFEALSSHWTARTPGYVIAAATDTFLGALHTNLASFRRYRWPRSVRHHVGELISAVGALTHLMRRAPAAGGERRGAWLAEVLDASNNVNNEAYDVRAALKMPAIGAAYTGPA